MLRWWGWWPILGSPADYWNDLGFYAEGWRAVNRVLSREMTGPDGSCVLSDRGLRRGKDDGGIPRRDPEGSLGAGSSGQQMCCKGNTGSVLMTSLWRAGGGRLSGGHE